MAMSEEEKKEARREASRKWYAAHKANRKNRQVKRGKAKFDHPVVDVDFEDDTDVNMTNTSDNVLFSTEDSAENKVVTVDPSLLTGIEEGTVSVTQYGQFDDDYQDDIDDMTRLAELKEIDPDELSDDEREELEELRETMEDDEWQSGRGELLRELEEQGAYDD